MNTTIRSSQQESLSEAIDYGAKRATYHASVELGGAVVRLHANTPQNLCHDWLSERSYLPSDDRPHDIEIYLIDSEIAEVPTSLLTAAQASAAGKRLLSGSYVGLKWPDSTCMIAQHPVYCLFGKGLDGVFWRYLVKIFLSAYAIEQDLLHLKASCMVIEGQGLLLDGMSGAGKTTLLNALVPMDTGAFVSNSHTLINFAGRPHARGVLGKMRVRDIDNIERYLPQDGQALQLEPGTYNLDPLWLFGPHHLTNDAPIAAIVTLSPTRSRPPAIRQLLPADCLLYYTTFMTALHRYYIRDDILEWLGWDPIQFHNAYERNAQRTLELLHACSIFEISADLYEPGTRETLYATLREVCLQADSGRSKS